MATTTDELEVVLAPAIEAVGAELIDIELRGNSLQVFIEREGGLDLASLEAATKAISELLDERENLAPSGSYELEVSSPGLERRLRRRDHYERVRGVSVALRLKPGGNIRRLEGTVLDADDHAVTIRSESGEVIAVAYADIDRAHTIFDWKAALAEDKRSRTGRGTDSPQRSASRRAAHAGEKGEH